MKAKTFDCIEMKHEGAEQVMKHLQGRNNKEQIGYWAKDTKELKSRQEKLHNKS